MASSTDRFDYFGTFITSIGRQSAGSMNDLPKRLLLALTTEPQPLSVLLSVTRVSPRDLDEAVGLLRRMGWIKEISTADSTSIVLSADGVQARSALQHMVNQPTP